MFTAKSIVPIKFFGVVVFFLILCNFDMANGSDNTKAEESKIWETKQIDIIRSLYLDQDGQPSHKLFLQHHGLYPLDSSTELTPYFTANYLIEDSSLSNGQIIPHLSSQPLNLDFYLQIVKKYSAPKTHQVIWDGRVYQEMNRLVVGGYSSKFNERPVGIIDDEGKFIPKQGPNLEENFPILQIPAEQIVFDPFEWKLLRVESKTGQSQEEQRRNFLPIKIYDQHSTIIDDIYYTLKTNGNKSTLLLTATLHNQIIEIAKCRVDESNIISQKSGYQPELSSGCIQPANGKVVCYTFKGEFSEQVELKGSLIQIKTVSSDKKISTNIPKMQKIVVDGYFQDWRNIHGVGDPQGDYVSYLYPNPDTDILEFKVTNDEEHLYLYSRVAGVHGRTGSSGRYYWYAYIDVDADPSTGYPPTRDDNCYFGVAIGDDCEAQFEFVGNRFVKTFFGFTGMGNEKEVLAGKLKLGPSFYAPLDSQGQKRDRYKVEYVNRQGKRFITHDYTEGSSEDINIALSPDGSEVEMRVEFKGFLSDQSGRALMYPGRVLNLAVGVEAASDFYGSDQWGADSSPVIYNYKIK